MWFQSINKMINSASKTTDLSLLLFCSKIFERHFNKLYKFFNENDLSSSQSGFRPGDSYINQLLSITHKIDQSFDNDLEVR